MIVIGDVHGEYDALMRLVAQLPDDKLCFAGDLINRGPKSCQVLDFVIDNNHDAVKGNHELMFHQSPTNRDLDRIWTAHGKKGCIDSFDGDEDKLARHREWARRLPLYLEYKDCKDEEGNYLIVSHTGINYLWEHADAYASHHSLFGCSILWENDWDRMKDREDLDYGFYNIFGHTPQKNGASIYKSYACIDGGGFIKNKKDEGYGKLIAMQYPSMKVWTENT